MADHDELLRAAIAAAHAASAAGVLMTDVVCALAEHPGVDRRLLLDQVRGFYAAPEADEVFQLAYNNLRARVVRGLEE